MCMLQGLKDTVKKLLLAWQANNVSQGWPRRLFFYRDGVSETQFKTVQALEITQIRMACEEVDAHQHKICHSAHLLLSHKDHALQLSYVYAISNNVPAKAWLRQKRKATFNRKPCHASGQESMPGRCLG